MSKTTAALIGVFSLIVILILLQSIFHLSPATFEKYFMAQIGVTVGVLPNSFNTLAQQLSEKESTLSAKEQEIQQKEIALREKEEEKTQESRILFYLSVVGGILFILVLLNFYLDYRRRTSQISS